MNYADFIANKSRKPVTSNAIDPVFGAGLFPYQDRIVRWAIRRERAAIFADTGLGKTRMQLEWARNVPGGNVLVLAPLAVAHQTAEEGRKIGVRVKVCRDQSDVEPGVSITNYDRLHRFDPSTFDGVVLDESSIIKHHNSKTLGAMIDAFARTRYRLCCTATPSPNDYTELGTHAEFLGICRRSEMLSEYFFHDGGDTSKWVLKGHARNGFWRWVSTWGLMVRSPADLGDDTDLALPPLETHQIVVQSNVDLGQGTLFAMEASTLTERRAARKGSREDRVNAAAATISCEPDEPWIVWCDLNDEANAITKAIPGAVQIAGADSADEKEERLDAFAHGRVRVLVSKPSICGFGLNWQHCARIMFVGLSDSYEAYYQAVRRCWRFGQKRPVHVYVVTSSLESRVVANVDKKIKAHKSMGQEMAAFAAEAVML